MLFFMNSTKHYSFVNLLCIGTLTLSACGKVQRNSAYPLSPGDQALIQKNLANGIIPSPTDVKNGTIPAASDPCATFKQKIPADWIQDTLEVPEDPAQPNGTKTHVFYYGKLKPNTTPVVFFNGGPGSDSHGSFKSFQNKQYMLDPNQDVSMFYIDQRGNGCSDPYPQMKDNRIAEPAILERLTNYGSNGIISDAELVRQKLIGNKPWIAFGQSYGAFVVHRYAAIAPTSLKSGFAHANTITNDGYERIKNRLLSQARVMDIYLKQYPDDEAALETLRKALVPTKCFKDASTNAEYCGFEIIQNFAETFLGFNHQWPQIHSWINIMLQDGTASDDGIQLFLKTFVFTSGSTTNSKKWSGIVIGWVDRNVMPEDNFYCQKIRTDLLRENNIDLSKVLINECMYNLQVPNPKATDSSLSVQSLSQNILSLDAFVSALTTHSTLQFFWYSGEKDPYVPVESFTDEIAAVKSLPNVHYTNFSGTGHDGFYSEPKVWQDLIKEIKR